MNELSKSQTSMVEVFQRHVAAELNGDIETTMSTMSDDPHLNHVPVRWRSGQCG